MKFLPGVLCQNTAICFLTVLDLDTLLRGNLLKLYSKTRVDSIRNDLNKLITKRYKH